MAKVKVDPALLIDQAERAECMGHSGIWFQGRICSSAELRKLARPPLFPLSPFSEKLFYMNNYGSDSPSSR
jgi:hypothetical protein